MSKAKSTELSPELMEQLRILENMPDEAIDFSDIPECSDWSQAKRGMFYRPIKQQLTLRLDSDLVAWFKQQSQSDERGYQTLINSALRDFVNTKSKRRSRAKPKAC